MQSFGDSKVIPPEGSGRPQPIEGSGIPYREERALLFDVRVERTDSLTHVELRGELDLSCEDQFGDAVDTVQSGRLVLDLRALTFIDSAGLRMILRTWQRSREEGFALEIVGGRDQVEKVFRITGLDHTLPMVHQISLNGGSQHSDSH
jgi:anti-sigma B factor antagonist